MAVVNRLHQDKISLVEAEAAEEAVFNELFEDLAEAYAPKTVQQQLRQNTTTAQLIAKLDHLFLCPHQAELDAFCLAINTRHHDSDHRSDWGSGTQPRCGGSCKSSFICGA